MSRTLLLLVAGLLSALCSDSLAGIHPDQDPRVRACLRRAREHPDSTALQMELAEAYRQFGTIEGRRFAQETWKELRKRHPKDVDVLLGSARLRMDQTFYRDAEKLYRKATRLDPKCVPAHFGLAQLAIRDWRRYLDHRRLLAANLALDRVLKVDPWHRDALCFRAFTYLANKDTAGASGCVGKLVECHPDDAWSWLLAGTLAQGSRHYGQARSHLERAMWLLAGDGDREAFETLRYVGWLAEATRETLDADARAKLERDFWKRADPTPATSTNERQLEHMRRIILAEIFYGVPEKRIRGWDTAAGEAIVRFGPPFARSVGIGEQAVAGFAPPAMIHVHDIAGIPVEMFFEDRNLSGRWLQPFNNGYPTAMDVYAHRSESWYNLPLEGPRIPLVAQSAQFRESPGRTRIELVFATPDTGGPADRFRREVLIYDRSWDSLAYVSGWASPPARVTDARKPGTTWSVDLVGVSVESSQDSVWIGSQVADTVSKGFGSLFEFVPVRNFAGTSLALSDILLLDRVGFEREEGTWARQDGWGVPSPDRVYTSGENVPFYFEAYNLVPGADGLVHYSVLITIEKARAQDSRKSRAALFDFKKPNRPSVETEFEESGAPGDARRLLDLEVGRLPADSYRLRLSVEDRVAGTTATAVAYFRVVPASRLSAEKR